MSRTISSRTILSQTVPAAVLFCALTPSLFAVTEVSLVKQTSPSTGQAGVGYVAAIGVGFPSGTISPSAVTVTLTPTSGTVVKTRPVQVKVISGTEESVTFKIPTSIVVSAPTVYAVTLAGKTESGTEFTSANSASLTVDPAAQLLSVAPSSGFAGTQISVALTGVYTHFVQGTTTASFGPGISVGGGAVGAAGPVTVTSATAATAMIAISATAAAGAQTVLVATGTEQESLANGFTVVLPSQLLSVAPSSGYTGAMLSVVLTGANTHFSQGTTVASFGPGISVGGGAVGTAGPVTVTSPTSATAQITISATASPGAQTVSVTTGTEQESLTNGFTVVLLPKLLSVAPNTGFTGTTFSVVLTGANTHFTQGSTVASFGSGISVGGGAVGAAGPVTVTSLTSATAQITISSTASPGAQTVQVTTGTEQESLANGFTVALPPQLISVAPNSGVAGTSLSVVLTGANTHFVQGTTTASFGAGISVGGGAVGAAGPVTVTSLTSATAMLTISASATPGTQTVQVTTGTEQESLTSGFTVTPAPQLLSVSPNTLNAGITATVTLTGANTHFVQGQTQASFGAGIAVGGATEGQPGPVTVTSPTTATAQVAIDPAATAETQTVTVTTGTETESLTSGFTIQPVVGVISINTSATTPLAPGFSGAQDEYDTNGVEYYDPKYLAMVEPMKLGWVRYPGGQPSMAFDWQTYHENPAWITELTPNVYSYAVQGMQRAEYLLQAKGGAKFDDFATFLQTIDAAGIVDFNGWTDSATSAGQMAAAAQTNGANIIEWEIDNEPYAYPKIFPTGTSYATSAMPFADSILTTNPSATTGVFYEGQYSGFGAGYTTWDTAMSAYSPRYWQGVSTHFYPITNASITTTAEEQTLNGFLANINAYFTNYFVPKVGSTTPIFITEWNTDGISTLPFESYMYNAIVLSEFIARVSTVPTIKAVGVNELYIGNLFNQSMIRAVDDYESYLIGQVQANPRYSTDTATNPNTQFQFYYSTNALGLIVMNQAINSSNATLATAISTTGIPTVPIIGFDGQPIPAVFAQAYLGTDGTHYVVITNKSSQSVPVAIQVNGLLGPTSLTASYVSSPSDTAQNTATAQTTVQIVNTTLPNPLTVGPYSITRVQW